MAALDGSEHQVDDTTTEANDGGAPTVATDELWRRVQFWAGQVTC